MNILIIGFQRSGTTLLRRLLQLHPKVRRVYHESFLLNKIKEKQTLLQYVDQRGINIKKDNWGEKVPYFPNLKGIPVFKYCETWNRYFGSNSRILHIVRHPYDVALSNVHKFKHIKSLDMPINLYRRAVPPSVIKLEKMKSVYTFKYEDLLINTDEMMFNIYKHCGLKPDINFRKKMRKIENHRYQKIDPSRAFAYKQQNTNWEYDLTDVFEILNEIDGVRYEL